MNKKKVLSTVFIVIIISACLFSTAFAYTLSGYKVQNNLIYKPNNTIGQLSLVHMSDALGKWNSSAGKGILMLSSITHNMYNYPMRDNQNYVYKMNTGTSAYVAQNSIWYNSATKIILESDIVFNMYYPYANNPNPGTALYDTYSIFLHEAGHTVGLDDLYNASDSAKVMYGIASPGTMKRNLHSDDVSGAQHIYVFPGI